MTQRQRFFLYNSKGIKFLEKSLSHTKRQLERVPCAKREPYIQRKNNYLLFLIAEKNCFVPTVSFLVVRNAQAGRYAGPEDGQGKGSAEEENHYQGKNCESVPFYYLYWLIEKKLHGYF